MPRKQAPAEIEPQAGDNSSVDGQLGFPLADRHESDGPADASSSSAGDLSTEATAILTEYSSSRDFIRNAEALDSGQGILLLGDALRALGLLPDELIQCCVTSPPYWGTRDYEVEGQIGAEAALPDYIDTLVSVFDEVKRVLREDGVLWLNIGDVYTSGDRGWRATDKKHAVRAMKFRPPTPMGLKPKDLVGVPWRLAFALQEAGWYLRADIIWHKPNCLPESVKDRPTRSHEYFFLLTKAERYYYDQAVLSERPGKNLRSVWSVTTTPLGNGHPAVFPPKLIEPCIAATTRPGDWVLDPFIGSGTVGLICAHRRRRWVGIELNPRYIELARARLQQDGCVFRSARATE